MLYYDRIEISEETDVNKAIINPNDIAILNIKGSD